MVSEFEKQFPKPTGNKYDHEYRLRRDEWLDRKEGALWALKLIKSKWDNPHIPIEVVIKKLISEIEALEKL